ncbi:hypothetical protein GCK32_002319 [Trichostrongylus colubriformis]|uniref:Uncharacterized protein n=1 Tax=Trichostrongylus colubriformis TaxID=6319 RepID=A0AAN8G064_TRICO
MLVQVLRGIVLLSAFNMFHFVQCRYGQCSHFRPNMHPKYLFCHYRNFQFHQTGESYEVDCYCKTTHEKSTAHDIYGCAAEVLAYMLKNTQSKNYRGYEEKCLEKYRKNFYSLWLNGTSTTIKATTSSATTKRAQELFSTTYLGGINETVIISPEREEDKIRIERKRVLDSAKLKLLVISTLMTTALSIQFLLIRHLRKVRQEWYESGLVVEYGGANAVVRMAAKKMKSAGKKRMKPKRKGALTRAKKFDRKPKTHRDCNRPPKKRSANVARSKNVSSDDNTTDLNNFYKGKQKGSQDSFPKELNRSRDASSEAKSK